MTAIITAPATAKLNALRNFERYVRDWTVSTKNRKIVPFKLTPPQLYVREEMKKARCAQGTRVRILKTRRMGASTLITAMCQQMCQSYPAYNALSIADKKELPSQWMRRAQNWYRQTPGPVKPHVKASNAIEMWYDVLGSRYSIGSQDSVTPGMGDNVSFIHLSEVGFWTDPDKVLGDLNPSVPKNDWDIYVIQESTGDMAGTWWEEAWWAAKNGEDDYTAIFVPWNMDPDNVMDASGITALTSDEQSRQRAFELSKEQIAWFRWVIRNEYKGDEEKARSRYPSSPEEAFLAPGRAGIPIEIMNQHRDTAEEPLRRVTLIELDGGIEAIEYHGSGPCWWEWEEPRPDCDYCIGADVAKGELTDEKDPRSDRDDSAAAVLNRRLLIPAAEYVGEHVDPGEFHRQLRMAHRRWGEAWMMPEINNMGWMVLEGLRGIKHLYQREGPQDKIGITPQAAYGWETTPQNRDYLIDKFISNCWNVPAGLIELPPGYMFDGKFRNLSSRLAGQERTFVTDKKGKRKHRSGQKDDILFAWMLALMCHNKCPRQEWAMSPPPEPGIWEKYWATVQEGQNKAKRW